METNINRYTLQSIVDRLYAQAESEFRRTTKEKELPGKDHFSKANQALRNALGERSLPSLIQPDLRG